MTGTNGIAYLYVRIRSWHVAEAGSQYTLCGRFAGRDQVQDFPEREKTCESCLRIKDGRG